MKCLTLSLLVGFSLLSTDIHAKPPKPIVFLRAHDIQVQTLLTQSGDSLTVQSQAQIKALINGIFDFSELSRQALGDHWQKMTPEEQSSFTSTFSGIIQEKNFDAFVRYYRDGEITYKTATVEHTTAVVMGTVPVRDSTVEIQYLLHQQEDKWHIYDLIIDGASTIKGYQRQYTRFLKKKTYKQLIERLNKQLAAIRKNS